MELGTRVADIELEHPIMNAAGPRCKTEEEIEVLARTPVAAVMVGSITWDARPGNQGDVYFSQSGHFSLNSLGLPNGGRTYYTEHLPTMARLAHQSGKTLWVSVAGFTPKDYVRLVLLAVRGGADVVEINLGCPNVWDEGKQKSIASFDPILTEEILARIEREITSDTPCLFAVKMSPYLNNLLPPHEKLRVSPYSTDPLLLEKMAKVIAQSKLIRVITSANTVPNAFAVRDDGTPAIQSPDVQNGVGGLAGSIVKQMGLAQVRRLVKLLPSYVDVIGVGGINSGQDVANYLEAGAKAVQIATAFADRGPEVFYQILTEFVSVKEKEAVAS
ncbi:MAG: dihydroorotate dehydrogenase [Candidatus Wildermuthbacteria bacterium]|nr:dihydroorotate dehydrogenase [Candidatus Wildermuthbacteria bacterium]